MKSAGRVPAIFLTLCLAVLIIVSCGKQGGIAFQSATKKAQGKTGTADKIIVRYWYPWGGDFEKWDQWRVSEFEKKNPKYKLEGTRVPEGAGISNGKLAAAINSGTPPDLVVTDRPAEAYSYAALSGFEPLDDTLKKQGFQYAAINKHLLPLMKYEGKTYLFPQNTDVTVLFYRTDLFKAAGLDPAKPPRTMDELDMYARKLTRKDPSGKVAAYGFIPWLDAGLEPQVWAWMFGTDIYDPAAKKTNLASSRMIADFTWQKGYAKLYNAAAIKSQSTSFGEAFSARHPFMTGKVAMTTMGNWFCNAIKIYAPNLQYDIAPLPAPPGGRYGGCALNANVCAVPKGAKSVEGAVRYALFCQEPYILDNENKQWRSLGMYPDTVKNLTLMRNHDRLLSKIVDITNSSNTGMFGLTSASTYIKNKLEAGLEDCVYNDADPAAVLKDINKDVQAQINSKKQMLP